MKNKIILTGIITVLLLSLPATPLYGNMYAGQNANPFNGASGMMRAIAIGLCAIGNLLYGSWIVFNILGGSGKSMRRHIFGWLFGFMLMMTVINMVSIAK